MKRIRMKLLASACVVLCSALYARGDVPFFQGLGDLSGGNYSSRALGVSADGSTVVGQSFSSSRNEAFRWTEATNMVGLGDYPTGGFGSIAYGVSANGSVIVGQGTADITGLSYDNQVALRWSGA